MLLLMPYMELYIQEYLLWFFITLSIFRQLHFYWKYWNPFADRTKLEILILSENKCLSTMQNQQKGVDYT